MESAEATPSAAPAAKADELDQGNQELTPAEAAALAFRKPIPLVFQYLIRALEWIKKWIVVLFAIYWVAHPFGGQFIAQYIGAGH